MPDSTSPTPGAPRRRSRYLEAFRESHNVIGLASILGLSAVLLTPLPLLVGLVAEAAYLIFVPDSRWYEQRLSHRYDEEIRKRREALKAEVLPLLRPDVRERFARLEGMRQEIAAQPLEDQKWFQEVSRKLDFLLEKFLQFAAKDAQFRAYLGEVLAELRGDASPAPTRRISDFDIPVVDRRSGGRGRNMPGAPVPGQTPRPTAVSRSDERWAEQTVVEISSRYATEIEEVRGAIEKETDPNTQAVLSKRLEVLERRNDFISKISKIVSNIGHQLRLLEDTFGLINDELRARSPDQVLADIEDVVSQTNTMTDLLEQVAPFEQMLQRIST